MPPAPEASSLDDALRALRQDHRNVALPGLFACWVGIFALLLLPRWLGPLHLLWGLPLLGVLQYRLVISGHEAVHRTLAWPEWLNELLGVAGQAMVGVSFTAYRLQHLDHHRARSLDDDPDGHIYGTVIRAKPGLQRFLVLTLGTLVELVIKIRQKGTGGFGDREKHPPEVNRRKLRDSALVVLTQLSLMALCAWSLDAWWAYGLLWIAPLFTVAVFLNRCRIVVEHGLAHQLAAGLPGGLSGYGGPRIPTVDIVPHPLEAWLLAPYAFHYPCCHPLFMAVPHYNLPALRALLRAHQTSGYHEVQGSYLAALRRVVSAPAWPAKAPQPGPALPN
jgi:fatty acid desaturase